MVSVFNVTQLVLVPFILILSLLLRKREKSSIPSVSDSPANDLSLAQAFFLFFLLLFCFRMLQSWFVFPEIVALLITFSVAVVLLGSFMIRHFYDSPYRLVYATAIVLPFIIMAQTFPTEQQDSVFVKKYKSIKIGFGSGNFENSHNIGQGSGCDRVSSTEYFKQEYTLGAVALEYTEERPELKQQFRYGAKAMLGNHRETRLSDNQVTNTTLFGVTPYVGFETNWLGFGGGLHMGNLTYITENLSEDGIGTAKTGSKFENVIPQAYVRVGPARWLFVDYHYADFFPSALPGFRMQVGVGTGLGLKNGTMLRFGTNTNDIQYLSGYIPIENKFVLEPMYLWGLSPQPVNIKSYSQFSLGLSYRFGHSEGKRVKKPMIP